MLEHPPKKAESQNPHIPPLPGQVPVPARYGDRVSTGDPETAVAGNRRLSDLSRFKRYKPSAGYQQQGPKPYKSAYPCQLQYFRYSRTCPDPQSWEQAATRPYSKAGTSFGMTKSWHASRRFISQDAASRRAILYPHYLEYSRIILLIDQKRINQNDQYLLKI